MPGRSTVSLHPYIQVGPKGKLATGEVGEGSQKGILSSSLKFHGPTAGLRRIGQAGESSPFTGQDAARLARCFHKRLAGDQ